MEAFGPTTTTTVGGGAALLLLFVIFLLLFLVIFRKQDKPKQDPQCLRCVTTAKFHVNDLNAFGKVFDLYIDYSAQENFSITREGSKFKVTFNRNRPLKFVAVSLRHGESTDVFGKIELNNDQLVFIECRGYDRRDLEEDKLASITINPPISS